jgi:hypothetical protein
MDRKKETCEGCRDKEKDLRNAQARLDQSEVTLTLIHSLAGECQTFLRRVSDGG